MFIGSKRLRQPNNSSNDNISLILWRILVFLHPPRVFHLVLQLWSVSGVADCSRDDYKTAFNYLSSPEWILMFVFIKFYICDEVAFSIFQGAVETHRGSHSLWISKWTLNWTQCPRIPHSSHLGAKFSFELLLVRETDPPLIMSKLQCLPCSFSSSMPSYPQGLLSTLPAIPIQWCPAWGFNIRVPFVRKCTVGNHSYMCNINFNIMWPVPKFETHIYNRLAKNLYI